LDAAGHLLRILLLETRCRAEFAGDETLEAGIETGLKIIFNVERRKIHKLLLAQKRREADPLFGRQAPVRFLFVSTSARGCLMRNSMILIRVRRRMGCGFIELVGPSAVRSALTGISHVP